MSSPTIFDGAILPGYTFNSTTGVVSSHAGQIVGQLEEFTVATFTLTAGGSAYTNGQYNDVVTSYVSGGTNSISVAPIVNITVAGGAITVVTIVNGGRWNTTPVNAILTVTNSQLGGTGTGFEITAATKANIAANPLHYAALPQNAILSCSSTGTGGTIANPDGSTQVYNTADILYYRKDMSNTFVYWPGINSL